MDIRDDLLKAARLLADAQDAPTGDRTWRLVVVHGLLKDTEDALRRELAETWPNVSAQPDLAPDTPDRGGRTELDNIGNDAIGLA